MRLLLVEDDRMIGESLQRALRLEGYAVDSCFGWNELVRGGVHLYEIPGGHLDILAEPYVKTLADKLRWHLDRVTRD